MSDNSINELPPGCGCSACMHAANTSDPNFDYNNSYGGTVEGSEANANSLLEGSTWTTNNLQYKFITGTPSYYAGGDKEQNNFSAFNTQMQDATIRILDHLETFTNLTFTQTAVEDAYGVLTFGQATREASVGGHAYYPHTHSKGGDVWINNTHAYNQTPVEGNYAFYTLLHEIGHALGLQHSFDVFSGAEATSRYSVMAYDTSPFIAESFMVYDIKALQDAYGANTSHNLGDNTYILQIGAAYTIWDAGGNDTFDASHVNSNLVLDLTEGAYSSVGGSYNIGIAYGAIIENATGGIGDDTIGGNDADNILIGNAGDDMFFDSAGNDTMDGGIGNDSVTLSYSLADYFIQFTNSVTVVLQNLITASITTLIDIEEFIFTDVTHTLAELDALFNMNIINGTARNNIIDGSTDDDRMNGLEGHDTIYGDVGNDIINGDEGIDTLLGEDGNDTLYGGANDDLLLGGIGDDTLHGDDGNDELRGNEGTDNLYGGTGNDRLIAGAGNDRLEGGDGDDVLEGAEGTNMLYGDSGNDNIIGGINDDTAYGGADNDKLYGRNGDDTLHGDAGNDELYGGDGNDMLYGGDGDDVLWGHDGNDTLYGGTGNNTLRGGRGNDIFVLDQNSTTGTRIMDFSKREDFLDITDLLVNYDSTTDSINDFIRVRKTGLGKEIQVDLDGTDNGASFVGVAVIRGLNTKAMSAQDADGILIY